MREAPPPRYLEVEQNGDVIVVKLIGPDLLDEANVRLIDRRLDRLLLNSGCRRFVLDLGAVRAMTSLMLAKLVGFYRKVHALGGRLALCAVGPELSPMFEWTRLGQLLCVCPSEREALRAV
jgi:anti-anti-sigma factor